MGQAGLAGGAGLLRAQRSSLLGARSFRSG